MTANGKKKERTEISRGGRKGPQGGGQSCSKIIGSPPPTPFYHVERPEGKKFGDKRVIFVT